jgi:integration host factor subunit alpha
MGYGLSFLKIGDTLMSLAKADLINSTQEQCGLSKNKSIDLVESLLELIKSTLESGEDVMISRFGKFCVKDKNERRGRNPHTGEDKILGAKRVVTFRYSHVLKEKINGKV